MFWCYFVVDPINLLISPIIKQTLILAELKEFIRLEFKDRTPQPNQSIIITIKRTDAKQISSLLSTLHKLI